MKQIRKLASAVALGAVVMAAPAAAMGVSLQDLAVEATA